MTKNFLQNFDKAFERNPTQASLMVFLGAFVALKISLNNNDQEELKRLISQGYDIAIDILGGGDADRERKLRESVERSSTGGGKDSGAGDTTSTRE